LDLTSSKGIEKRHQKSNLLVTLPLNAKHSPTHFANEYIKCTVFNENLDACLKIRKQYLSNYLERGHITKI